MSKDVSQSQAICVLTGWAQVREGSRRGLYKGFCFKTPRLCNRLTGATLLKNANINQCKLNMPYIYITRNGPTQTKGKIANGHLSLQRLYLDYAWTHGDHWVGCQAVLVLCSVVFKNDILWLMAQLCGVSAGKRRAESTSLPSWYLLQHWHM